MGNRQLECSKIPRFLLHSRDLVPKKSSAAVRQKEEQLFKAGKPLG
jgi:hypothetical protein